MSFAPRFLWNSGDIVFSKSKIDITPEQAEHAKKAIDELIIEFEKARNARGKIKEN